jgi:hypothetical protein
VRFLEPEDEAMIQTLEELFSGMTLAEASNLIADGRVVDAATSKVLEWQGYPMVLPVSDALRERVTGEEYEARVAETRARLDLAISEPVG